MCFFRIEFNKVNNAGVRMLDSIYHMTLNVILAERCVAFSQRV